MKLTTALTIAILAAFQDDAKSQEISNADFSQGKTGWVGDGTVVHVAPDGSVSASQTPNSKAARRAGLEVARSLMSPVPGLDAIFCHPRVALVPRSTLGYRIWPRWGKEAKKFK